MSQNIFSIEGLISWLEMQPGETEYDFSDVPNCLLSHYLLARTGSNMRADWLAIHTKICGGSQDTYLAIASTLPHTYAAALTRARELVG